MTSKQRVFSHSTDINYNDYIKNKNAIEILKDIKNNQYHYQGDNPNNIIIKKFANHQDLINFTKTYYKYVNLNNYSLKATEDLYNSNISVVDGNSDANAKNNFKQDNNDCNNSNYYNECSKLSQVLYPESYYVSNDLSGGVYLHFNLDLNKWCVNKTLLDYNKIYNFDNNVITPSVKENETNSFSFTDKSPTERNSGDALRPNFLSFRCNIDGFNGCANSEECYNLQYVRNRDNDTKLQKRKKCRTGMCGNAKPLFV